MNVLRRRFLFIFFVFRNSSPMLCCEWCHSAAKREREREREKNEKIRRFPWNISIIVCVLDRMVTSKTKEDLHESIDKVDTGERRNLSVFFIFLDDRWETARSHYKINSENEVFFYWYWLMRQDKCRINRRSISRAVPQMHPPVSLTERFIFVDSSVSSFAHWERK